jgi:hypothetical protein
VIEKLTKNVNEDHLREIFGVYGQIRDLDMPINRNCKLVYDFMALSLTCQSIPIVEQHTSSTLPKPTPKLRLLTCTNPKLMEPSSTFRLFSPGANSLHLHLLQDVVQISTLVGLQQLVSALLQHRDVDLLLQVMADLRGTLIHIGQDLSQDLAPRDATEPGQDLFLRALDPHQEGEEDGEIALVAMVAGGEEARVIAATAVMMIGVEAGVVDMEVVADVSGITIGFKAQEFRNGEENCNIDF